MEKKKVRIPGVDLTQEYTPAISPEIFTKLFSDRGQAFMKEWDTPEKRRSTVSIREHLPLEFPHTDPTKGLVGLDVRDVRKMREELYQVFQNSVILETTDPQQIERAFQSFIFHGAYDFYLKNK